MIIFILIGLNLATIVSSHSTKLFHTKERKKELLAYVDLLCAFPMHNTRRRLKERYVDISKVGAIIKSTYVETIELKLLSGTIG